MAWREVARGLHMARILHAGDGVSWCLVPAYPRMARYLQGAECGTVLAGAGCGGTLARFLQAAGARGRILAGVPE